jgi:hypothetical protein
MVRMEFFLVANISQQGDWAQAGSFDLGKAGIGTMRFRLTVFARDQDASREVEGED